MVDGPGTERAAPVLADRTAGVLPRLGLLAKVGQVGVEGALERSLARADESLEPPEMAVLSESLELLVRVEDQGRPGESTRPARARRVQPDDEERASRDAE